MRIAERKKDAIVSSDEEVFLFGRIEKLDEGRESREEEMGCAWGREGHAYIPIKHCGGDDQSLEEERVFIDERERV